MARILMTAVATPGHVYPMLGIARHLIAQGHQVRVMTGALFRERAEAIGAKFVAFDPKVDFDYRYLEEHFPERAALPPGNVQMALALKDFFAAPIPLLNQQLRTVIAAEATDLLMVENCFYGVLPLLQAEERPPVIGIGVTPLSFSSEDSIFYGPRIPPVLLPRELRREQLVDDATRALIDEVQQSFDAAMTQSGGRPLHQPFSDALIDGCDRFLQLATPALEYRRDDLPAGVRFIGPLRSAPICRSASVDSSDAEGAGTVTGTGAGDHRGAFGRRAVGSVAGQCQSARVYLFRTLVAAGRSADHQRRLRFDQLRVRSGRAVDYCRYRRGQARGGCSGGGSWLRH
jgi:UDP:flavonoid glycosyltransferase YjiC (YdhE family)